MSHSQIMRHDIGKIIFLYLMFTETYGHCRVLGTWGPCKYGPKTWRFDCGNSSKLTNLKMGMPVC